MQSAALKWKNIHSFSYFASDAWLTLIYQILKLYYISRVNLKAIKSVPNLPPERSIVPDSYINNSSNVYGSS